MRHKFREGLVTKIPIWKVPSFTLKNAYFSLKNSLNLVLFTSLIFFFFCFYIFTSFFTSSSILVYYYFYSFLGYFTYLYHFLYHLCYTNYVFLYLQFEPIKQFKEKVNYFLLINNIFIKNLTRQVKKVKKQASKVFFNRLKELNINILKFNKPQLFVKEFLWNSTVIMEQN